MKVASNKLSDLYKFYQSELSALYDAEELYAIFGLVCETYLGIGPAALREQMASNVNQSGLILIYDAAKALKTGQPVQYILKQAYFYDAYFEVAPGVLIPRPETEELVDLILKEPGLRDKIGLRLLDIGSGSGCIPITLKKHWPWAAAFGMDVSEKALELAHRNAVRQQAEVLFLAGDALHEPFDLDYLRTSVWPEGEALEPFGLIVSNPPYIGRDEAEAMAPHVLKHEPHLALFVDDEDPVVFYRRMIDLCESALAPGGYLFFELNPRYAFDVKNYAKRVNLFNFAELITDMSGKDRFLKAQRL